MLYFFDERFVSIRFFNHAVNALFQECFGDRFLNGKRYHNHRYLKAFFADKFEQDIAVNNRHLDVEQHQIGLSVRDRVNRFGPRCRALYLIIIGFENLDHPFNSGFFTVNSQDFCHNVPPCLVGQILATESIKRKKANDKDFPSSQSPGEFSLDW